MVSKLCLDMATCCCSLAKLCPTLCSPMDRSSQASLSFTISCSLLKFMSVELMMLSNHLVLCRPLLLLHSIIPNIRVFSNELTLHIRWPKYWSLAPAQGNQSLSRELRASALCPGLEASSHHAGEKRGVAGLLLGRTERAARAAELQLCAQAR